MTFYDDEAKCDKEFQLELRDIFKRLGWWLIALTTVGISFIAWIVSTYA